MCALNRPLVDRTCVRACLYAVGVYARVQGAGAGGVLFCAWEIGQRMHRLIELYVCFITQCTTQPVHNVQQAATMWGSSP